MATRSVFPSDQQTAVTETEDEVVQTVRRDHPNPVKLEESTARPSASTRRTSFRLAGTLWENGGVLVIMDEDLRRLENLRQKTRVRITMLGREDRNNHVTLRGYVAELMPDPQFTDIDRLSEHESGRAYPQWDRDRDRVSVWIEVTSWHSWAVIEPWTGGR